MRQRRTVKPKRKHRKQETRGSRRNQQFWKGQGNDERHIMLAEADKGGKAKKKKKKKNQKHRLLQMHSRALTESSGAGK